MGDGNCGLVVLKNNGGYSSLLNLIRLDSYVLFRIKYLYWFEDIFW